MYVCIYVYVYVSFVVIKSRIFDKTSLRIWREFSSLMLVVVVALKEMAGRTSQLQGMCMTDAANRRHVSRKYPTSRYHNETILKCGNSGMVWILLAAEHEHPHHP